jgi:DNA-binding transcriptional regulator YiaG
MDVIAVLIGQACTRRKLATKAALAAQLGVTPQRLRDWESGTRRCPDVRLVKLATLAGVDPATVIGTYGVEWLDAKGEIGGD